MGFSIGIVGLPNVGKSTLFKTLTKKSVEIAAYPFTTIRPNVGIVQVPDERLNKIAEVIKPEKVTPTIIEFVDIAGLVKGAHKGEGLGNQFLAQIKDCYAILEVVRAFENPEKEEINPEKEIEIVKTELLMKDLETLENAIKKIEKEVKSKDKTALKKFSLLQKIKESVSCGNLTLAIGLSEEEKLEIKEYQFLTQKPIFHILNTNSKFVRRDLTGLKSLAINLKEEEEISELSESEAKELGFQSKLDRLILACYNILDLITFYTIVGEKEARAWTIKRNSKIIEAAGKVHSDFEERFIRAEIIPWQKLVGAGSWPKARESGGLKTVGRDYVVQDGDVIEFKI